MSKRNRNKFRVRETAKHSESGEVKSTIAHAGAHSSQAAEYKIISSDLIRLVVLNAAMLALVLVVYFTNLHTGYLENFFLKFFKI